MSANKRFGLFLLQFIESNKFANCALPLAMTVSTHLDFWDQLLECIEHNNLMRKMDANNHNFVAWKLIVWSIVHKKSIPVELKFMKLLSGIYLLLKEDYNETVVFFDQVRVSTLI